MRTRLDFDRLVHSDWSIADDKRWTAVAVRSQAGWLVEGLTQTPPGAEFLQFLFDREKKTLAGFDFPIGLPSSYMSKTKLEFRQLLSNPGSERTRRFLTPVETLADISPLQPFYRRHPRGGRHANLWQGLGCESFNDLLRECDRKTAARSRAESIFWTIGPKQVGKAALSGWQDILIPALARKACLWPFDGPLKSLESCMLTMAETYPAEAYQHIGMTRIVSKRRQEGRKAAGAAMLLRASQHNVRFLQTIERSIRDGFGESKDGEDPFDAIAGLCGMIEVADGRRAEAPPQPTIFSERGEGWILGQIDLPSG